MFPDCVSRFSFLIFCRLVGMIVLGCIFTLSAFAATSIPFTVNMSEAVDVVTTGGTPRIAIDVDGNTRYATYSSGTGTSALTFTYAATAGDLDLDGVTLSSPIQLNGGTIKDLNGNNATLTFTVPNTSGVKVSYPSLSMDFTADSDGQFSLNGTPYSSFSSFLTATGGTFSRASTATYFNSSGVMQTAASGAARFDYDPATLTAKGLLIEEARTNILKQSNAFTTAPWDNTTCGGITNSGSTTTAPDGTSVPIYNLSTSGCIFQDVGVTIGNSITHSIWIKANKTGTLGFRTPGTGATTSSPIVVGTTWQRYKLTATAVAASSRFLVDNRSANGYGVTGLQISFFGGQMEVGTFATSYIPTTTVSVTRAADALTVPIGGWFNATEGTALIWTKQPPLSTNIMRFLNISNGGTNRMLYQKNTSTGVRLLSQVSGSTVAAPSVTSTFSGSYIKIAGGYKLNNYGLSVDGSAASTATGAVPSSLTQFEIGSNGVDWINTGLSQFKYYPLRVSDTQLQLLTQ